MAAQLQRIQELEEGFQAFNQVSLQLEATYRQLESQVGVLTENLRHIDPTATAPVVTETQDNQRLQAILKALPAGVVVLDGKGFVQEANPAAKELLGEPLEGEAWTNIIGRAFAPRSDDGHDLSLADGRRVSISTCPLGDVPGQVLLFTDVTETRRLQDEMSQHQRLTAMGEMAAGLAHQIRTPLASGLLYASRLKMPAKDESQRKELVEKVVAQLRHLETLINDMLLFSRSGYSGDEQFRASELITKLAANTQPFCQERQIQLDVDDCSQGEVIKGNANILLSALQNLSNNALQAMQPGGTLTLCVRPGVCNTVELSVADTGPGISDAVKDKLFKPFFTTRSNGTGLGLSVVRAVAQAHGGSVRVEDSASGGCDFIVQLPVQETHSLKNEY